MLSMFLKFELVRIRRYFVTLANARRPSRTPSWMTCSPGRKSMTSGRPILMSTERLVGALGVKALDRRTHGHDDGDDGGGCVVADRGRDAPGDEQDQ